MIALDAAFHAAPAVAVPATAIGSAGPSSYELLIRAEPRLAQVEVSGVWSLPRTEAAGGEWSFQLSPLMRDFRIDWMRCGSEPLSVLSLERREAGGDDAWRVRTHKPCERGRLVQMAFRSRSQGSAPQFRVGQDGGFAGGGGELWYPQRAFADRDTGRITLDLPAGLTGIATGVPVTRETRGGRTQLTFDSRTPGQLAFAFGRYRDVRVVGAFPVRVLTTTDATAARSTAENLTRSLTPLAEAFGPPPFPELALVEVDFRSRVAGTSEYGMIFAEPEKFQGAFDLVYWAHEFGHQWWGDGVRAESGSVGATLLTEGLAQYGALYALEQVEGAAAASEYRRAGRGQDRRQSLAGYRELLKSGEDRPAAGEWSKSQDEILLAHRLATSKGALLLDHLARLMGRNAFHAVLKQFYTQHEGGTATWADLEQAINAATSRRYAAELQTWFHGTGEPEPFKAREASLASSGRGAR